MAKAKSGKIDDYSDRFSSPIGVKNLVMPSNKKGKASTSKSKGSGKKSGK